MKAVFLLATCAVATAVSRAQAGQGELPRTERICVKGDCQNGYGEYVYGGSGGRYEGAFKDGVQNGQGKQAWPDGTSYDGTWEHGKQNGMGVKVWPDGTKYDGEWISGKHVNKGTFTFNKKDGPGTYTYSVPPITFWTPGGFKWPKDKAAAAAAAANGGATAGAEKPAAAAAAAAGAAAAGAAAAGAAAAAAGAAAAGAAATAAALSK